MDELLVGLAELETHVGRDVARFSGRLRGDLRDLNTFGRVEAMHLLEEAWPDELVELCEHVELLKLLVFVCEARCGSHSDREG